MLTLALAIFALVALKFYYNQKFMYWNKRKVKYEKPIPVFGNFFQVYLSRKSSTQKTLDLYWKYPKERVVGVYMGTYPALLVRDVKIIKQIFTVDSKYFNSRGVLAKYEMEPMLRNLFHVDGDLWRLLRQRLTPAFTIRKLKAMFPLIADRAQQLQRRTLVAAASGAVIDARDLMSRYTTDFIGACGFGLESNSLNEENSALLQMGMEIFDAGPITLVKTFLKGFFPTLFKNMKYYSDIEKELITLVKQIMERRKHVPSERNDFIDLLIECKNKGKLSGESMEKFKNDGTPEVVQFEIDEILMAAQVFIFFAAGFETSTFSTSFFFHQMAFHPEIQKKVQEEIDRVLARYDNKLCYDAIKDMSYLTWALKESMRLLPSGGVLVRKCERPYEFKDLNFSIDEGVRILIPVQALHTDPMYFENPDEFRPERFDPQQIKHENKYVYLPFGGGPRGCIGERLGLMQSLSGVAAILSKFTVSPAPQSLRHPITDTVSNNFVQVIKGGLPLVFKQRQLINV